MPELLNDQIKAQLGEAFAQLTQSVQILFFGTKEQCEYCDDTRQLAEEVAATSEKISVSAYSVQDHAEIATQYNVDKTPGLVIAAQDGDAIIDYGIRHAGIPSEHEFSTLIQDILLVSSRDSGLAEATREFLKTVKEPVLLQVFATPT
ncbi:MAG: thioredoxin family protein [Chloroflexota bacterium]